VVQVESRRQILARGDGRTVRRTGEEMDRQGQSEDPTIVAEVGCYLNHGNVPWENSPDAEVVKVLGRAIKYVHGKEPKLAGFIASGELHSTLRLQWTACGMAVT